MTTTPSMDSKYSCLKSVLENDSGQETKIKRKFRTSLTVKNKLEVIEYATLHPNATQSKIASHFGIDRTTVSKVLKRRADILTYADQFSGSSNELMYTSLMKKGNSGSPSIEEQNNSADSSKEHTKKSTRGDAKTKLRQILPKEDMNTETGKSSPSRKSVKYGLTGLSDKVDVYHPELHSKCESWFMEQNLSPNKTKKAHEHIADIRSFSKLLSVIPLSDADCYKILAGKCVRDACMAFVARVTQEPSETGGRPIGSRSFELLHRFLLEGMPEVGLDQYYCDGFSAFEADDVKRIWVKYVQPKLHLLDGDANGTEDHSSGLPADSELTIRVTPEEVPEPSDQSLPPSPDVSMDSQLDYSPPHGLAASVRGSRKRKMNSKPVKITAMEAEGGEFDQSKDDGSYVDVQNGTAALYYHQNNHLAVGNILVPQYPNENVAPENLVVPNKKRKSTSGGQRQNRNLLNNKKSPLHNNHYPVIEIKPDGCSDDESHGGSASHSATTGGATGRSNNNNSPAAVSFTNTTHLILTYAKSLEERIHKMEVANIEAANVQKSKDRIFQTTVVDGVVKKCTESLGGIMNALTEHFSQFVKTSADNSGCNCQCSQLKANVERLEGKIDALQGSLNSICETLKSKE